MAKINWKDGTNEGRVGGFTPEGLIGTPTPDPAKTYRDVQDADPKVVAEVQQLSSNLDADPLDVSNNLDAARHAATQPDWKEVSDKAPTLYKRAADPAFAAKAKNDFDAMLKLEEAYRKPELTVGRLASKAKVSFRQAFSDATLPAYAEVANQDLQTEEGITEAVKFAKTGTHNQVKLNRYTNRNMKKGMGRHEAEREGAIQLVVERRNMLWKTAIDPKMQIPEDLLSSSGTLEDVIGAMAGSVPGMALTAATGPAGGSFFFTQMWGAKYRELINRGIDHEVAKSAALVSAAGQAPLETAGSLLQLGVVKKLASGFLTKTGIKLAGDAVVNKVNKKALTTAMSQFLGGVGISMAGEGMEEYLQTFPDLLGDVMADNPDMTLEDTLGLFISKIPETALSAEAGHSALIGALAGGGFTTAIGGPATLVGLHRQTRAENFVKKLEELQKVTTDIEKLDKEAYVEYLNEVAEEHGEGEFYVDPDVLLQTIAEKGLDVERWASLHGTNREVIMKALDEGDVVAFQAGRVIGALKEDEVIQGLINDMTVRRDDVSFNQLDVAEEQDEAAGIRLRELFNEKVRQDVTPQQIVDLEEQIFSSAKEAGVKGFTRANVADQTAVILAGAKRWVQEMNKLEGVNVSLDDFFDSFKLSVGQPVEGAIDTIIDQATPEFKAFFEGSQVTEEDGSPKVVYHGTNAEFSSFKESGINWFTTSKEDAKDYDPTRTIEVFLSIKNPADLDNQEIKDLMAREGIDVDDLFELTERGVKVKSILKALGYDGVVVSRDDIEDGAFHYAAFNQTQIKSSTDNRGTFDPQDPNIFRQSEKTFEPEKVTTETLPESTAGVLPSKAEQGQYYNSTADELQTYLDQHGDGFLYRVTRNAAIDAGFDVGLENYKHQFKDSSSKVFSFSSSFEDTKAFLAEQIEQEPDARYIIYRVQPQDLAEDFAIQIPSERSDVNTIHVQSPLPAGTNLVEALYRNNEFITEDNANDESRGLAEDRRREAGDRRGPEDADELRLRAAAGRDGESPGRQTTEDQDQPTAAVTFTLFQDEGTQKKLVLDIESITLSDETTFDSPEAQALHNTKAEILNILEDGQALSEDAVFALDASSIDSVDESLVEEFLERTGDLRTVQEIYDEHLENAEDGDEEVLSFDPPTDPVEWAILGLGTTEDINEAGYILPDGQLLDLSGKNQGGEAGTRSLDHRQLPIPTKGSITGTDLMIAFQEEAGAIRIDANSGLVDMEVKPTGSQMEVIEDLFFLTNSLIVSLQDGPRRSEFEVASIDKLQGIINKFYRGQDVDINILFQDDRAGKRGEIQFTDGRATANIELTKNADLSTFLHETSHFFLEMIRITATKHGAFSDEWATIKEFIGAEDGVNITREQHEKWAKSWEQYMAEGKAPSLQLQGAFDRFTRWLKSIYGAIKPGGLTDEVRSVMDKLLATEEEIEEAKVSQGLFSIIDDEARAAIGQNSPEMAKYLKALGLTEDETARAIDLHKMKNLKERRKEYTEQAVEEWRALLSRRAIMFAKSNGGISSVEIEAYGVEGLPRDVGLFRTGGMPMQAVADDVDMTKDELVELLRNHPTQNDYVEARVSELEQEHDEKAPADEMIHNAALREQMTQESALLAKLSRRERVLKNRQISKYAKDEVGKMNKKQVRDTNRTITALRKARVEANRLVKLGKYEEALDQNEKARLNEAILAEQIRSKENITKIERRWTRIFKSIKKNPSNYDMAFRDQIFQLSNRFQFFKGKLPIEEQQTLTAFFEQLNSEVPDNYENSLDLLAGTYGTYEWLYDEELEGPYNQLPYEQLTELDDLIKFLQKNGRVDKNDFLLDGETRIDDIAKELVEAVKDVRKGKLSSLSVTTGFRKLARRYGAEHIPLQYILVRMDGYKTDFTGANMRLLFNPLSTAAANEHLLQKELKGRLEPILDELRESAQKHARLLRHVPTPHNFKNPENSDVEDHWTFDKVLAVALNMGNEDNLQKLMDGYGWEYENVLEVINILTEQDLRNVQNLLDVVDSMWPQISAMHKKIHGFTPKRVTSEEFIIPAVEAYTTASGMEIPARVAVTMKGGYYPLRYDSGKSRRQSKQDDRTSIMESQNAIYPSTKTPQGFTIGRQKSAGNKPVLLSMAVLTDHLNHVAHHVTHADVVTDVDRITKSSIYSNAVTEAFGTDLERQIRPALARVANPKGSGIQNTVIDNVLEGERSRAAAYILWYNIRVALKQPFSLFNLWQAMGTMDGGVAILSEYASLMSGQSGNLYKYIQQVHQLSPNMARRAKAIDRELQRPENFGAIRKVNARESVRQNLDKLSDATGPILIRMMDMVAAYPGWMAAYKQGLSRFNNDMAEAVAYADNVISATQPFDRPLDQSMVRGAKKGLHRFFTMFTGYTMKYANRRSLYWQGFTEHIKSGGKTGIGPVEFMSHVLLERMLPSLLMTTMLSYTFRDEPPEPEDYLIDMLLFQFAGRAVVQDVAAALFTGARYGSDSVFRTPLETGAKTATKATRRLYESYENGDIPDALFAFFSEVLGYWYKLPFKRAVEQTAKTIEAHE